MKKRNETRNENAENSTNSKNGKLKGFLKKLLITTLVLALLSPVVSVLGALFSGIGLLAEASVRDWFTIVDYVDETTITISNNNGETFDVKLVGIVMDGDIALDAYIGDEVYLLNDEGIEIHEVTGDMPSVYLIGRNEHIIQGEMLAAGTASMTDEEHTYYNGFDNCAWYGEYRI